MNNANESYIPEQYIPSPQSKIISISFRDQPERFNSLHWVFAPLASTKQYYQEYLVTLTGAVRIDDDKDASPFTGWWRRDFFIEAPFQLDEINEEYSKKPHAAFILQQWTIFISVGGIGTPAYSNSDWYVNGFGLEKNFLDQATRKTRGMKDAINFWVTTRASNKNSVYSLCYQINIKGYLFDIDDKLKGFNLD